MDEAMVRELAARVEDHRLDFKEGLYLSNAELAKDLMAIANMLPPGSTGHILLGVRQRQDDTGEIVGVQLGVDRDSNYQQKVHGKLNRTPRFSFFPLQLPEGETGVFEIVGIGDRPYFPIADAEKLRKNIASKRQGSSTAAASPDEVREWVLEDRPSKEPAVLKLASCRFACSVPCDSTRGRLFKCRRQVLPCLSRPSVGDTSQCNL